MSRLRSADAPADEQGRQYHLAVKPGEVMPYILLCGDPARAELTAKFFDTVTHNNRYREFVSISGVYRGCPLTVTATGIGCDNTEIAVIEISQCVEQPTFLRIGTCGALQPHINHGDMVVSTAAMRLEDTSRWFAPIEYPAVADPHILNSCIKELTKQACPYHLGITASCSGFYGAQGRTVGKWQPFEPGYVEKLAKLGVLNFEMETSTLFVLSSIGGFRAGSVCTVYANRPKNTFIKADHGKTAESRLVQLGLDIILRVYQSDQAKNKANA